MKSRNIALIAAGSIFSVVLVGAFFVPNEKASEYVAGSTCKKLAYALADRPSSIEIIGLKKVSTAMAQFQAIDWISEKFGSSENSATKNLIRSNYEQGRPMYNVLASIDYSTTIGRNNITCHYIQGPLKNNLELKSVSHGNRSYTNFFALDLEMLASKPENYENIKFGYIDKLLYLVSFSFLSN